MPGIRVDESEDIISTHSGLTLDDGTNPHGTTKANVGLGNVDNTSDANKPVSTATQTALNLKYNASNPNGYETPSQLNSRDTSNRARANHTGTQTSSTIIDFASTVISTVLTGISFASSSLVTASDSILVAIGKLQGQLSSMVFGRNYTTAFTSGNLSTSSGTFATVQTLTANGLTSGNYLLQFSGCFEKSLAAGKVETQFVVNGTPQSDTICHIPLPDDDYRYAGQSDFIVNLSGDNTITFQWRKSNGGGTIQVNNRRMFLWRVS